MLKHGVTNRGESSGMTIHDPRIQEHGLLLAFLASAIAGMVAAFFLP